METTVKPTMVIFDEICDYDKKTRIFRIYGCWESIWVESFENGIAIVKPAPGSDLTQFCTIMAGCFQEKSNFEYQLCQAFDSKTSLTSIQFEFNGVTVTVTKENANVKRLIEEWNAGWNANMEEYRLEKEAYMQTPEYRAKRAKELKVQYRKHNVEKDVIAVDESTEVEFKDDNAKAKWEEQVAINSNDDFGLCVVTYARRWAKYMQHLMTKHNKKINLIAENASYDADLDGVTGFMYGCAVSMLSENWKYGDELRKWHNKQYGQEDCDGVINPAALRINVE